MTNDEILKQVLTSAAPLIGTATEIFLKPKIKDIARKLGIVKKNFESIFENQFQDYLLRSYEKYSIMNTIVFHNQQKLLESLYVPLTIVSGPDERIVIDKFPKEFSTGFQRILITDTAGMGKSTLLKRLFLSIIDENKGIPILVELRRLSKQKDIVDEILEQLNSITKEADRDFILYLIEKGDFIFLLDGYDEIPSDERRNVTRQIQSFINKAGNNSFILTSRPENALASFGDFKGFKIRPLQQNEAHQLLRKYDPSQKLSEKLIKKLNESNYRSIDEFLTNPLLVSLLFAAFEHKQTIPIRKHIFYRQVYDALFESHDLTKGDSFAREKFSKLDIDEFHSVLRHIGYNCLTKGKIEFSKDEMLLLIQEAKCFSIGINFKESDFFKDLFSTVPLFTRDGIYYKWSHKSLQEYFAAQFIFLDSKEKQRDILLKLYYHKSGDKFLNVFDLYYSIDYKSFSEVIIREIITDFFNYLKKSYRYFKGEAKRQRQLLTFAYHFVLIDHEFKHSNAKEFWKLIKDCTDNTGGWSLLIRGTGRDSIIVPSKETLKSMLLVFLYHKGEPFVKRIPMTKKSVSLLLEKDKGYFVDDKKQSLLNSPDNFEKTSTLITNYHHVLWTIDETKAKKYLNEMNSMNKRYDSDKLLDF